MMAPRRAEQEWHHATTLIDHHPTGVQLMLDIHALRPGQRWCVQCGPLALWPCEAWRIATLAQMLPAAAPAHRWRLISWPRRKKPISWFDCPDSP